MPEVYPGLVFEHECQTCGARYYGEEAASGCPCNPDGQPATVADGGVVISSAADGTHNGQPVATDGGEQVTDENPQGDREAIQQHIVESMRFLDGADEESDSDSIVCPSCAQEVDTTIEHVVHRVPEHGEDDMNNVFYCSHSCFSDHMDFLFSGGENDAQ